MSFSRQAADDRTRSTGSGTMRMLAASLALTAALLAVAAPTAHADHEPFGTNFGIAGAFDGDGDPVTLFDGRKGADPNDPDDPTPRALWAGACDTEAEDTSGTGVGTADSPALHCIDSGAAYFDLPSQTDPVPGFDNVWQPGQEPSWRLNALTQAGAHPDATLSFWFQRWEHSPAAENPGATGVQVISDGEPKDVIVKLPAGFVGNPNALPRCPAEAVRTSPPSCPPETQIGVSEISLARAAGGDHQRVPIWNVEPRRGKVAEFMLSANINEIGRVNIPIVARARTDGDFGIDALALNLPSGLPVVGQTVTLWGVPWDASHDKFRAPTQFVSDPRLGIPPDGFPDDEGNQPQPYDPSWGPIVPFLMNPTECDASAPPVTRIDMASWRFPSDFRIFSAEVDAAVTGCGDVPFDPSIDLQPTSAVADGPSGLSADLTLPQLGESPFPAPAESDPPSEVTDYVEDATEFWKTGDSGGGPTNDHLSTSQLEKAVVTLPEGVSINPSAAAGLAGCSDAQFGQTQAGPPAVFNNEDPFDGAGAECPAGSRVGTASVYTPLLPLGEGETPGEPNLTGDVVLGTPQSTDPTSGKMFRLFLVLRNEERGLVAKISGSATAHPATGQLTTVFQQNPRVPFETLSLDIKGGERGTLALPQRCESVDWASTFTPWTAAHGGGGAPVPDAGSFVTSSRCAFGFAPNVNAGMDNRRGGGTGSFTFTLSRQDGEQWLRGLTAELPLGLLASVGDVPLCKNAQAAAAACPAASRVGTVDAAAGSGTPFVLEKKGSAYLTEGYKGAPYGLATIVPVEAGPFTGSFALSPLVVRQALRVDPQDASVTVESDPFPLIHHGIPLRARQVTVKMDRPDFMRNPTDCSPKQLVANLTSAEGATSRSAVPFQASACGELPFSPKLTMRLTGKRQVTSGKHPGVRARVTQPRGQSGIKRVVVRLPKKVVLDSDNARDLCEYVDGIKPDLERHCPPGSIVGRARATSPLLSRPLSGNVYFVKNVRFDPDTGNAIRTLPMVVVALRGEIAVNLKGESSTTRSNQLVNTFATVPDAPVDRFDININGGRNGILVVTENARGKLNICGRQTAEVDMDAQNGRRLDSNVRVKTPCKRLKRKVVCKTKKQRRTKACKRKAAKRKAARQRRR